MKNYAVADLTNDDVSSLDRVKPADWPSISEIHAHYLKTPCSKCMKVIDEDGEILGIGTGLAFDRTGWLAHIIVSKDHQGQGIGTRIVQDRISLLRNTYHCASITLTATDQGYPVYKKLGFAEESMYVVMVRSKDPKRTNTENGNIVKATAEHVNDILEMDRVSSGERRAELLLPILSNCYVYQEHGSVLGFYLPQFGDGGVTATTEEAGIALLQERTKEERRIYVPEENHVAYEYLRDNGYDEIKRIHRMVLGDRFPRNPRNCYSRIGGFAG